MKLGIIFCIFFIKSIFTNIIRTFESFESEQSSNIISVKKLLESVSFIQNITFSIKIESRNISSTYIEINKDNYYDSYDLLFGPQKNISYYESFELNNIFNESNNNEKIGNVYLFTRTPFDNNDFDFVVERFNEDNNDDLITFLRNYFSKKLNNEKFDALYQNKSKLKELFQMLFSSKVIFT